ncbi:hypothetical protein BJ170DRAFT_597396 [Xylariales sp. AK1849]|nr:hypothetical protein BJ170DRAFT_597396 [Xylariales sp. AK1849]
MISLFGSPLKLTDLALLILRAARNHRVGSIPLESKDMAEAIGLAASIIAVVDLSVKVVGRCKSIIETAKDAPRDLRALLVEVSSLKSALENLDFLSNINCQFSQTALKQPGLEEAVKGCHTTLGDLVEALGSLAIQDSRQTAPRKRQKVKDAISWTWKEDTAKKLLADLLQHKTTITLSLLSQTAHDIHEVKTAVGAIQETLTKREKRHICNWLEQTNPSLYHNTALKNYESHTGQWMLRMSQWLDWLNIGESSHFVWIHGIPGSGKTILASFLITQCQSHCKSIGRSQVACVYYYCSYRNNQDEAPSLLKWLICQLCRQTSLMPTVLDDIYGRNEDPDINVLKTALHAILEKMETVYFLVDAVDESRPRQELLLLLEDLATDSRFQRLRILATSRRYLEIESVLSRLTVPVSMSNTEVDQDIRKFVSSELNRRCTGWRATYKPSILDRLVENAQGM